MPRACLICADSNKMRLAAEMIASGQSDESIAKTLGGLSRGSARRHRVNHAEREARAVFQAANRTRDIRADRNRVVAAAEAGDVAAAFLSLERIAMDLRRVQERLERTAEAAEGDQQRLAVASLSSAALRAVEVRARLRNLGGYGTPRSEKSNATPFVLNIHFSGGRTERIEATPIDPNDPAFDAYPALPSSIADSRDSGGSSAPGVAEQEDDEVDFDEEI